jgi:hypothetical protein
MTMEQIVTALNSVGLAVCSIGGREIRRAQKRKKTAKKGVEFRPRMGIIDNKVVDTTEGCTENL